MDAAAGSARSGGGVDALSRLSPFAGAPDRPVFVGACPRSGTTLLRSMLDSHPALAMPRESRFLVDAWQQRDRFGDLSDAANRRRFAEWIFRNKATRPGRFGTDPDEAIERLVAAPPTLGSLSGTPFVLYAERHGKARWGDKRPHYAQQIPALFAMFPDAQFINVVRDPRACAASIRKLGWFGGDVALAAELWGRARRAVDACRGRLARDQFLEIRYEDLVTDPGGTLETICGFLGLPASEIPRMLDFHRDTDVPENRFHWRVSQPVTQAAVRGWEDVLGPQEAALVERVTAREMRRYGYEPAAAGERVPPELWWRFARRRAATRLSQARHGARETRLRVTYRHPVAARLTSAQCALTEADA